MSRIGKRPVPLPKGVTATIDGRSVRVKGPKGELNVMLANEVEASVGEDGVIAFTRDGIKNLRENHRRRKSSRKRGAS